MVTRHLPIVGPLLFDI